MKITALIENNRAENHPNLKTEHGLSLYIEHNDSRILMDCGSSDAFAYNAERLGIDLDGVDLAILSHHHYDHGGGLSRFFEINSHALVYLAGHPAGAPCFKALGGMVKKYIGLDKTLFERYPDRFRFIDLSHGTGTVDSTATEVLSATKGLSVIEGSTENRDVRQILPDLFLLTQIHSTYPRPKGNQKLLLETDNGYVPDDFSHEVIVVMKQDEQLVILTGCAHSGILNMVETVVTRFPDIPIKAVVGGFHLAGIPIPSLLPETESEIKAIATELLTYPIETVYTGHCTGMKAYGILKGVMGERLEYLDTGRSILL